VDKRLVACRVFRQAGKKFPSRRSFQERLSPHRLSALDIQIAQLYHPLLHKPEGMSIERNGCSFGIGLALPKLS
jgi:hypothetical protein